MGALAVMKSDRLPRPKSISDFEAALSRAESGGGDVVQAGRWPELVVKTGGRLGEVLPIRKMDATPWKAYESIGFSLKAGYETLNF